MRRISAVCLALVLVAATSSTLSAQQSIYMLVDSIRGDQTAPHNREFKLSSFSSASSNPTTISSATSGVATGKTAFSPVKVSMRFHAPSSGAFNRSLALGTKLPSIEIRHYNAANAMFYKTVYENVFLTSVSSEGSDEAQQQIEFVFMKVKWFASPDASGATAPAQIGCWDLVMYRTC